MRKSTRLATVELAPIRQSKRGRNDDIEPATPNGKGVKRMRSVSFTNYESPMLAEME
jgi:hypothetical protein